jgi:adhesin transport system membrane fusion protein
LLICTALFATFLIWAYFAQIDEVARGAGRVITSSKGQIVQSLEGGIVKEILVREGDKVEKGQALLLMDKTGFASDLGELEAKELALLGAVTRLQTETANPDATGVKFPDELRKEAPSVVQSEEALFAMKAELDSVRERCDGLERAPSESVSTALPADLSQRLKKLETRMEEAEVFFVRIDEMVRRLAEAQGRKTRKRFLGIF